MSSARLHQDLNVLTQLARVDGNISNEEVLFLYKIGLNRGLAHAEIEGIIAKPAPAKVVDELTPIQKLQYLNQMVDLMKVDQKLQDSEIMFCRRLADQMGFRPEIIMAIYILSSRNSNWLQDPNQTKKISQKYFRRSNRRNRRQK